MTPEEITQHVQHRELRVHVYRLSHLLTNYTVGMLADPPVGSPQSYSADFWGYYFSQHQAMFARN